MKEANPILEMSYRFALEVMSAAKAMRNRKEYDLASQFWRAGSSIGANVEEVQASQSRADFKSKMAIAAKEARESGYWLRLLAQVGPRRRHPCQRTFRVPSPAGREHSKNPHFYRQNHLRKSLTPRENFKF